MRMAACLILTGTFSTTFAWAAGTPDSFAEIEELIEDSIERGRVPAVSVAVIEEGRVVWAGGFGTAQMDTGVAASADTPYILASVSKPMTATGLMVLTDQGKVDLDTPVNAYLGGGQVRAHVGDTGAMTVRRLANHTSGMPTHWNFFYEPNMPPPMDETIAQFGFAAWTPGTRTNYSNLAFGILNYVTERVSGTAWGAFMESAVYDPAGMPHTSHRIRPGLESIAAHSYTKDTAGRWVRVTPYAFDHPGASAIWSSANDLARFLLLHMNGGTIEGTRILSQAAAEEMQTVHADARAAGSNYGVGWNVNMANGAKQIQHGGGMPGVRTQIAAYPKIGAGYVVLSNGDGHNVTSRVATALRKALLPPTPKDGHASNNSSNGERKNENETLSGKWTGRVVDGNTEVPLEIRFRDDGALVRLGEKGVASKKATVSFGGGPVTLRFSGRFGAYAHFHGGLGLELTLFHDEGKLNGALYALAPGYFCLPYYAEASPNTD